MPFRLQCQNGRLPTEGTTGSRWAHDGFPARLCNLRQRCLEGVGAYCSDACSPQQFGGQDDRHRERLPRGTIYCELGPEFGGDTAKIVIFIRALYGLKSAGASFRNHLADCMRHLGWESCMTD